MKTAAGAALGVALLVLVVAPATAADEGPSANDTARFLAGLMPAEGSPLRRLTGEASWRNHARFLDQAWRRLEKRQLSRIRAWSKRHLPEHRPLMLYMFSGPDFLYADAFYPHASNYVLAALEPVGPRPDVTRLTRGGRTGALYNLRASLQTILTFSFFRTKDMKKDFRGGRLAGALPVIYVFLARSGKTIEEVELVSLTKDGTVEARSGRRPKGTSAGVRIAFSGADGRKRTLYYFATDLSNWGLKKSGFREFCTRLGPADSLVKSASYLLHSGNFVTAREFLLEHSRAIVQDDSGIPVRYFSRTQWKLHPFGKYLGPINVFPKNYQPEMRRLFARGAASKIDFGIGYRWRVHQTNVLLALKRAAPPPKTD